MSLASALAITGIVLAFAIFAVGAPMSYKSGTFTNTGAVNISNAGLLAVNGVSPTFRQDGGTLNVEGAMTANIDTVFEFNGGQMVGFVSIGDLVKYRIDHIEAEAEALRTYIQTA